MSGKIYLMQPNQKLDVMIEQPYASENLLQTLLEKYYDLLAGEQIDPNAPRRWLLVAREMAVPGEEEGGRKWSLDHLFLDQDAIPTLVEVKRASDTRIRREVVGQMLDYAANAVVYWPLANIRSMFEATCQAKQQDPDQLVMELVQAGPDDREIVEQFWGKAKTNLQAGKVRLVFVADQIPQELQRVVEFLNEQMDPAEVLAVELRQYVSSGEIKTLVPRVVGLTAEAQRKKSGAQIPSRKWDEESFFQELKAKHMEGVEPARKILEWAQKLGPNSQVWWGKGAQMGSFVPVINHKGRDHQLFAVYTYGSLEVYFYWYMFKAPFDDEAKRLDLLNRLNAIPGVKISSSAINKRPNIRLSIFKSPQSLKALLDIFDWVIHEIENS